MDFNKDYYKVLGVDKHSTPDQIKSAFRKKAKEYHPDGKVISDDTMIKEINEANTVLGDDNSRRQYDQQSPHGSSYNPNFGGNPFTIFENFGNFQGGNPFGNPFGQAGSWFTNDMFANIFGRHQEIPETIDITYHHDITLKDIYNNYNIIVRWKRYIKCVDCDWTGQDLHGTSYDCEACDGQGFRNGSACELCRGTGKIFTGTCEKCNGAKVILKEEEFTLSKFFFF